MLINSWFEMASSWSQGIATSTTNRGSWWLVENGARLLVDSTIGCGCLWFIVFSDGKYGSIRWFRAVDYGSEPGVL